MLVMNVDAESSTCWWLLLMYSTVIKYFQCNKYLRSLKGWECFKIDRSDDCHIFIVMYYCQKGLAGYVELRTLQLNKKSKSAHEAPLRRFIHQMTLIFYCHIIQAYLDIRFPTLPNHSTTKSAETSISENN
jgi:hypothetical protein